MINRKTMDREIITALEVKNQNQTQNLLEKTKVVSKVINYNIIIKITLIICILAVKYHNQ